jgi:putative membrane protein
MKKLMILAIALMAPALATAAEDRANLNDAQVAAIVVAANQIDIDAGKLAESKTPNPEVKAFAHRMVAEHTDVNKQATDLATKLKMTPEENTISRALKSDAKRNMERLRKLSGKDFDKLYVSDEVAFHKQVLDTLDNKLLPNAKNEELKALLVKVRPAIASHLEHAEKLLSIVHETNYKEK